MTYNDSLARSHARADWLERLLHRHDARFESARQFGFFTALVIETWHAGAPGLRSSAASAFELAELGTVIQTSITLPEPPSLSYHIEWIVELLHAVHDQLDRDHDRGFADQVVQIWAAVDIHDETHRRAAELFSTSKKTVGRRLEVGRRRIHTALERADRLTV